MGSNDGLSGPISYPIIGGSVRLVSSMGSDTSIVNAARQSFNKNTQDFDAIDIALINFLMVGDGINSHGSPFEMVEFVFQVTAPLTVAREWFRHRISNFNELSGRYTKIPNAYYIPKPKDIRSQKGKSGSYTFETIDDANVINHVTCIMTKAYANAYRDYEQLLEFGVAKELARNVLPQGMFTSFRYKTNARSLMNFLSLRNAPSAMLEIRKYAECMEEMFQCCLPYTHQAFIDNGRVAP